MICSDCVISDALIAKSETAEKWGQVAKDEVTYPVFCKLCIFIPKTSCKDIRD